MNNIIFDDEKCHALWEICFSESEIRNSDHICNRIITILRLVTVVCVTIYRPYSDIALIAQYNINILYRNFD